MLRYEGKIKIHMKKAIIGVWLLNIGLIVGILGSQSNIFPFVGSLASVRDNAVPYVDGFIKPIGFVPDWAKGTYIEHRANINYETISKDDFIPLPVYGERHTDFNAHFTYMNAHAGQYLDDEREEHNGSHAGVDIRAPFGSPVFSIANGVVTEVVDKGDK